MRACVRLGQFLGFRVWVCSEKSSHSKLFISFALFLLFPSRVCNVCWDTMGGSAELWWEAVDCVCWRCEEPLHQALATKAFGMCPWLTLFTGSISHAPRATDRQGWGLNTRQSYWKDFVLFLSTYPPSPPHLLFTTNPFSSLSFKYYCWANRTLFLFFLISPAIISDFNCNRLTFDNEHCFCL